MAAFAKDETSVGSREVRDQYTLDGIEDDEPVAGGISNDKGFTKRDQMDMHRLGKRQELLRNFRPLSALSFTVLLQATWEYLLM
jgi:choline transport protein